MLPDHVRLPLPLPDTTIDPFVPLQTVGSLLDREMIGAGLKEMTCVPEAELLHNASEIPVNT